MNVFAPSSNCIFNQTAVVEGRWFMSGCLVRLGCLKECVASGVSVRSISQLENSVIGGYQWSFDASAQSAGRRSSLMSWRRRRLRLRLQSTRRYRCPRHPHCRASFVLHDLDITATFGPHLQKYIGSARPQLMRNVFVRPSVVNPVRCSATL